MNSSGNEYGSRKKSPIYEGMEEYTVFVIFIVLREVCSTSRQSSSSKQTLEKIQGTYEFICKMSFLECCLYLLLNLNLSCPGRF